MQTSATIERLREGLLGALAVTGAVLASPLLRSWYRRWGATPAEEARSMPGDELVPRPRLVTTRAITIHAPARTVWSWLVQLGQGRGGFYSYESLENLAGCDIHDADTIIPALQEIAVGDCIRLGPAGYPFFTVAAVSARRSLVLQSGDGKVRTAWSFALDTLDSGDTRLVVRDRTDFPPTLGQLLVWRVLTDPIHFVMERKMLLGIKARAEGASTSPRARLAGTTA